MVATLLFSLAALLLLAKVFGEIAGRLSVSPLVGEILAGVVLAPVFASTSAELAPFAGFGIIFLLFLGGLSTKFDEIKGEIYHSVILCVAGGLLSAFLGYLFGMLVFGDHMIALFLGIALLSTSTAVSVRSLIDVGEFNSRSGKRVLGILIADDILAIASLAVLTAYVKTGTVLFDDAFKLILLIIGFIVVLLSLGSSVVNKIFEAGKRMNDEQGIFSLALVMLFIIAAIGEDIGIAAVTGAFLAGTIMNRNQFVAPVVVPKIKAIGYGFFVPLFFAYTGLALSIPAVIDSWYLIAGLTALVVLGKIIGSGYLSMMLGSRKTDAFIIGTSLVPRGEYALIISQIALGYGIITGQIYSIVVAVVIITIILTPILLKFAKWI